MNRYELMVIVSPDIGADSIKKRLEAVRKLISSQKGEIFFEDLWGMRELAHRIKKHDRGYYAVFDFNVEEGDMQEMDTTLRLENEVLRHMILKLPSVYEPKTQDQMAEENEARLKEMGKAEPQGEAKAEAPAEASSPAKPKTKTTSKPKTETKAEEQSAEAASKTKTKPKKETAKAEPKKEEPVKASKATKEAKEKEEPSLEDVDAKLKSIIDDPDLNF